MVLKLNGFGMYIIIIVASTHEQWERVDERHISASGNSFISSVWGVTLL